MNAILLSVSLLLSPAESATQTRESARVAFGVLSDIVAMQGATMSESVWRSAMTHLGLTRKGALPETTWSLRDAVGEVRAEGFFDANGSKSFMVRFFPQEQERIPDALLARLIQDAKYAHLEDGENYSLGFEENRSIPGWAGVLTRRLVIRLQGGTLRMTAVAASFRKG